MPDTLRFHADHRSADLKAGDPPPPNEIREILWGRDRFADLSESRLLENIYMVAAGIRRSSMFHPIDETEALDVREAAKAVGIGIVVRKAGSRVLKVFIFGREREDLAERIPDLYEELGFRDFIVAQIAVARMTGIFLDFPHCCVESFVCHLMEGTDQDLAAKKALESYPDPEPDAYFVERFVPCSPGCKSALAEGKRIGSELEETDPSLVELYEKLKKEHIRDITEGRIIKEKMERDSLLNRGRA